MIRVSIVSNKACLLTLPFVALTLPILFATHLLLSTVGHLRFDLPDLCCVNFDLGFGVACREGSDRRHLSAK